MATPEELQALKGTTIELPDAVTVYAPEPKGPVDFAIVKEIVDGAWTVIGALWLIDGSIGFDPAVGFEHSARVAGWFGILRQAWEMGAGPARVFKYWSRFCQPHGAVCLGPVERADSLDELRRRLGWPA
jgi:hypothetical protein